LARFSRFSRFENVKLESFRFLARKLSTQIGDARSIANHTFNMKRIAIIGSTGSGKSTLAKALAARLGGTWIDLDDLHWAPGWIEIDDTEFRELTSRATNDERWVSAGNYSPVRDIVWGRADTIVWLDYSFPRTAYQLVRRTIRRSTTGEPCCNGNRETWTRQFGRDSILLWLLKSYWRNRRNIPSYLSTQAVGKTVHVFRSPRETSAWLRAL
jgi:adenylate kinase family enzyme